MQAVRRPLHFAIVDEADAQLVDLASSPFLIAADGPADASCQARVSLADEVLPCLPRACHTCAARRPRHDLACLGSQVADRLIAEELDELARQVAHRRQLLGLGPGAATAPRPGQGRQGGQGQETGEAQQQRYLYSVVDPRSRSVTLRPRGCQRVLELLGAPAACSTPRRPSAPLALQRGEGAGRGARVSAGVGADERGKLAWVHEAGQAPSEVHLWQEPGQQPWGLFLLNALKARRLFVRGRDYLVENGAVRIVDPSTGRTTLARWIHHLHQVTGCKRQ